MLTKWFKKKLVIYLSQPLEDQANLQKNVSGTNPNNEKILVKLDNIWGI